MNIYSVMLSNTLVLNLYMYFCQAVYHVTNHFIDGLQEMLGSFVDMTHMGDVAIKNEREQSNTIEEL